VIHALRSCCTCHKPQASAICMLVGAPLCFLFCAGHLLLINIYGMYQMNASQVLWTCLAACIILLLYVVLLARYSDTARRSVSRLPRRLLIGGSLLSADGTNLYLFETNASCASRLAQRCTRFQAHHMCSMCCAVCAVCCATRQVARPVTPAAGWWRAAVSRRCWRCTCRG
jgi:hypothetical protein